MILFQVETHWVCYYNDSKETISDHRYYFDSYGLPPPIEIVEYLGGYTPSVAQHNIYQIQKSGKICGHLCLYFLNRITKGNDFNNVIFSLLK